MRSFIRGDVMVKVEQLFTLSWGPTVFFYRGRRWAGCLVQSVIVVTVVQTGVKR